ncbi:SDR family NAD(P)-dependent oxidoreductase, partial [Streptomyces sodiiphilus]|uniref:SDR family NAD(P)-dependent oxidoreductase n=1 Tax=Streptomyces sodiiphilus TaxID=226217 RepID=UPI0031DBC7E5
MTHRAETFEKTFTGDDPFVAQHRSGGTGILPASMQMEMALLGLTRGAGFRPAELTDVAFVRPFTVPRDGQATIRLDTAPEPEGKTRFELSAVTGHRRTQVSCGTGRLLPDDGRADTAWQISAPVTVAPENVYTSWLEHGLEYGPGFRTVRSLRTGEGTAEAVLHASAQALPWYAHPLLVDGVFQVVSCALQDLGADGRARPMLPIGFTRFTLRSQISPPVADVTVRVRRTGVEGAYSVADALVLDQAGNALAEFGGIRMRHLPAPGRPGAGSRAASLMTAIRWRPAAPPAPRDPASGTWVVLRNDDRETPGRHAVAQLRAEGARVVEVFPSPPAAPSGEHRVMPVADEDAFRGLWEELGGPVQGVLHLWSTGPARAAGDELRAGLYSCLAALRTLGTLRWKTRFLVVTENAQPVADGDTPLAERAALWGLMRTAAIEYPGLNPRLVDLDASSAASAAVPAAELGDGPVECGYRGGTRHEPVRVPHRTAGTGGPPVRPGGRYLILGGHGGLGLEVAARFAREGAGAVGLVSRSGGPADNSGLPAALASSGCTVLSLRADVSVPGELASVVERFREEAGDPHGVVHAAGTLKDGLIRSATAEDVAAVLRPKADGARELASAVTGLDLDFAVLFASVSGAFGNLGQGGYAAANAYLDAFAHARGEPWVSIDWGLWGEVGMGTAVADQLRRRGVRPLGTEEALDALMTALGSGSRQLVIAHPDATSPAVRPSEDGGPGEAAPSGQPEAAGTDAGTGLSPEERVAGELERFLAERLDLTAFDRSTPLGDYGINSIMSVELAEELSRRWGSELPATLFLEYGDFAELAEALAGRYGVVPPAPRAPVSPGAGGAEDPEPAPAADTGATGRAPHVAPAGPSGDGPRETDIAIVAVSGDLPGAANPAELWDLLRSGGTAFTEVPPERWDIGAHYEERGPEMTGTYCRVGAFVGEIDRFDPKFFGISVREAEEMDPQQKLLLEHAWSVIDGSGLAGRRDIGVFVGASYTHHRDANGLEDVGPHTALGSMNALLANRISYALDLTGPSQTVDTLCSSSLVAVQQAVTALRTGQCGAAVVAACHVGLTPWYYRSLSQLGALSPSRPRPFDERADGFVPGEGAIAVMLKRLGDAERDGDHVQGVIRGTAVNHGGRGSALPVPRSESQAAVIRAALADAGLPASAVSLVEAHGTATRLGDPIEIAALTEVFGQDKDRGPCFVGSVKANIGHLEPAAGLAGLVKVLLCMRHGEVPPLAGFGSTGPHIDLSSGPFVIPAEPRPWRPGGPRRAGVSAFGMGGTNAHIVVEEYPAGTEPGSDRTGNRGEHVLVVSGHTPDKLAERLADLERHLSMERPADAAALCFSAAVGREHLPHRVAVLGSTVGELTDGLRGLTDGVRPRDLPGTVVRGRSVLTGGLRTAGTGVTPGPELAGRLADRVPLGAGRIAMELRLPDHGLATGLAFLYAGGHRVDWASVHAGRRPRRLSLPPYPFRPRASAAGPDPERDSPSGLAAVTGLLTGAHRVLGQETVPAALLIAMGLERAAVLERISFTARGTGQHVLAGELSGDGEGEAGTVTYRHGERVIARLTLGPRSPENGAPDPVPVEEVRAGCPRSLEPAGLYAWFAAKEMLYAPPLTPVTGVRYGPGSVLAEVDSTGQSAPVRAVAAIDAALQSMAVLTLADPASSPDTYLPVAVRRAVSWGDPSQTAFVHLRSDEQDPDGTRHGHALLLAADGRVLASLEGIVYRTLPGTGTATGATAGTVPRAGEAPAGHPPAPGGPGGEEGVVELVREVLRDPEITATTSLSAAGLDSMLATMVAAGLGERLGIAVSPTDVLDARDCRALAASLAPAAEREPAEPAAPSVPQTREEGATTGGAGSEDSPAAAAGPSGAPGPTPPAARPQDMAVVGLACALPGAQGPEAFWSMLSRGGTATGPAPAARWTGDIGTDVPAVGGFLSGIEEFDAEFFDFFPKQAEVLDPQARWLLRTAWEALEDAGIPPLSVPAATGVFVGASYQHYREHNIGPELDAPSGLGNHNAFLANRV